MSPSFFRWTAAVALALVLTASLAAEASLSANDLTPGAVTTAQAWDGFTVLATPEKGVTVEAVDKPRTAPDGEVFNLRIKLNGGGSAEFRAIRFVTSGPAKVSVYANSSSKTDARLLKLVGQDGGVAELPAPPDDEAHAGLLEASVAAAGTYWLYSASGGINLYAVEVR
jgi:hypothetical protein